MICMWELLDNDNDNGDNSVVHRNLQVAGAGSVASA